MTNDVPDLQSRSKPVLWIVLGLAVLAAGGGAVWYALGPKDVVDPGPAACAHIERQAEIDPDAWDEAVDAIVDVVQQNVSNKGEPIKIESSGRADRCREMMRKLSRALEPAPYQAIASCLAAADLPKRARACLRK